VDEEQPSVVHASWSLQFLGEKIQPLNGQQESTVQAFLSLQVMALYSQTPPLQVSVVHRLLSLQFIEIYWQFPVSSLQESIVQGL
jgi:hypothetical protein